MLLGLLGCGCMIALLIGLAPRLVLISMAIFGERLALAYDSWIIPLLGFFFLPYTTIFYALVWNAGAGVSGWDWIFVGLGLLLDIGKWALIFNYRHEVPGYPDSQGAVP